MKNDLILKRYNKETDNGTKNMNEVRSFFGSKLIDIEDTIIIDNKSIQYTELQDSVNDGFQYYDNKSFGTLEVPILRNLSDLKEQYHTIKILNQNIQDLENNTKWNIEIDIKKILKDYLFVKIKEARSFKSIKKINTKNRGGINLNVYKFIDYNVLNRYEFDKIDFYVKYENILNKSTMFQQLLTQYNCQYDDKLFDSVNIVKDYSLSRIDQFENLSKLKIVYNQTKSSIDYKFNYYFNIFYKKI